jgi:hypothetical protein
MKKESSNKLKCQITGNERISNATYLADKAYKYGISVAEWKAFYVSKPALNELKAFVANFDVAGAGFEFNRTEEDIKKMVSYNGGGGFLLRLAEKNDKALTATLKRGKKKAEVALSTEDAAVALELATAEIERTKEALIEKNETTDRDRKLARRRELYAAKKNQLATV